jgi:hypothetical protein
VVIIIGVRFIAAIATIAASLVLAHEEPAK